MGYTSRTEGVIRISPRIIAKELREHKDLTENTRDAFLAVTSQCQHTDTGEIREIFAETIVTPTPSERYKRYNLDDNLREIVAAFPDRVFEGRIISVGEDGAIWATMVRNGKVTTVEPELQWPE